METEKRMRQFIARRAAALQPILAELQLAAGISDRQERLASNTDTLVLVLQTINRFQGTLTATGEAISASFVIVAEMPFITKAVPALVLEL
jgi:hypothetical protein